MGGINTLVVLDLRFAPGASADQTLQADRYWIDSKEEIPASLNLSGNEPSSGWRAVGGGVVEVPDNSEYQEYRVSQKDIRVDPLKARTYRWDQTLQRPVYWLVLILPPGQTLGAANPEPRDAGVLQDRFAVFWDSISIDQPVRRAQISWELSPFTGGDLECEVNRLRSQLPLSEKRQETILQRITFMRRGLGIALLVIALIAAWLALPSGLAISAPHIPSIARIPATLVCLIAAALSLMGLAKGWSLASLFVRARTVRRRSYLS
jgi:hypothetical protein